MAYMQCMWYWIKLSCSQSHWPICVSNRFRDLHESEILIERSKRDFLNKRFERSPHLNVAPHRPRPSYFYFKTGSALFLYAVNHGTGPTLPVVIVHGLAIIIKCFSSFLSLRTESAFLIFHWELFLISIPFSAGHRNFFMSIKVIIHGSEWGIDWAA